MTAERPAASRHDNPEAWVSGGHEKFGTPVTSAAKRQEIKCVEVVLPVDAVQLLYDVLGHFPHDPGSWANVARGNCMVGLWDAKSEEKILYA